MDQSTSSQYAFRRGQLDVSSAGRGMQPLAQRNTSQWNAVPSDRCMICGSLRVGCRCGSAQKLCGNSAVVIPTSRHRDPEVQQRLKDISQNYPHEIAKRQNLLKHVIGEEERARQRLVQQESDSSVRFRADEFQEYQAAQLEEQCGVQYWLLEREEATSRKQLHLLRSLEWPRATLGYANRTERLGIAAEKEREIRRIVKWHIDSIQRIEFRREESSQREACVVSEMDAFAAISAVFYSFFETLDDLERDRAAFIQEELMVRHDYLSEIEAWFASKREVLEKGTRQIASQLHHRHQFFLECQKRKDEEWRVQEMDRRRIKELMAEEHEFWEDVLTCHRSAVNDLFHSERRNRENIEHDFADVSHSMYLDMQRCQGVVEDMERTKRLAVDEFLRDAFETVGQFAVSLQERHLALLAQEKADREATRLWAFNRHVARYNLVEAAEEVLLQTFTDATSDLRILWDTMKDEELAVEQWIVAKLSERERFVRDALSIHATALYDEQLDIRRQLFDQMLLEEDQLYIWMESKAHTRNLAAVTELEERRALYQAEDERWRYLMSVFEKRIDALWKHWDGLQGEREQLIRVVGQHLAGIAHDEELEFNILLRLEAQHAESALLDQLTREIQEFQREETAIRHDGMLLERQQRNYIRHLLDIEVIRNQESSKQLLMELIAEIETNEERSRMMFHYQVQQAFEIFRLDKAKDAEISLENQELRIKQEYKAKQAYLLEDRRLYDDQEMPISECKMNLHEFRKSVSWEDQALRKTILEVANRNASRPSAILSSAPSTTETVAPIFDEVTMKRRFLSQVLQGQDCSTVPIGALNTLTMLFDGMNESLSHAKDEKQQIENVLRDEAQKCEKLQQERCHVRSEIEAFDQRLKRKVQDHAHSLLRSKELLQQEETKMTSETGRIKAHTHSKSMLVEEIEKIKELLRRKYGGSTSGR